MVAEGAINLMMMQSAFETSRTADELEPVTKGSRTCRAASVMRGADEKLAGMFRRLQRSGNWFSVCHGKDVRPLHLMTMNGLPIQWLAHFLTSRRLQTAATVELAQVSRGFQLRLRRNWFLKFFSPSITSASTMSSTP